jgi:hypothetical protein
MEQTIMAVHQVVATLEELANEFTWAITLHPMDQAAAVVKAQLEAEDRLLGITPVLTLVVMAVTVLSGLSMVFITAAVRVAVLKVQVKVLQQMAAMDLVITPLVV